MLAMMLAMVIVMMIMMMIVMMKKEMVAIVDVNSWGALSSIPQ